LSEPATNKILVAGQGFSNGTITVKVAEGTNYKESNSIKITVTSERVRSLSFCTWGEIKRAIAAGKAADYWNAGDRTQSFSCTYSGVGTITAYWILLGLDHNYSVEANGKTHYGDFMLNMTLTDEKYSLDTPVTTTGYFSMTHTNDYATFANSDMVAACNKFKNALPTDLKNVLVTPTKYSSRIYPSSNWSTYTETMPAVWIFDVSEVSGDNGKVKRYDYFSNGNRINSTTNTWTRTTENNGGLHNVYSYAYGNNNYLDSYNHIKGNYSLGFLPCIRIGA